MFSWLPFGSVRAPATLRAQALATATLEHLARPDESVLLVSGGRQTKGALPVVTSVFEAAIYSSRGRGYARYNEDGALLFADERGGLYAGVFDQAGGLGGKVRGAASDIAARAALLAFQKLATGPEDTETVAALKAAVESAHQTLIGRAEGEVTTAVLARAMPEKVYLVSSGDSAAMLFDVQGNERAHTREHAAKNYYGVSCLIHAVGLEPESHAAEDYEWLLSPGEWLILASDGFLDAGLSPKELAPMLASATSAEALVNQLASKILRRMALSQAKPDNLTMVAIRKK